MLVDGHLRAETITDAEIPVLVLDVNEAEADKILARHLKMLFNRRFPKGLLSW
jgi:hypothetical protein